MGKGYVGKTCVYCATEGASETEDHVFAREFFPLSYRSGLPKVPACLACNGAKSKLEHYLTTVLPIAGANIAASDVASLDVPRRLAKNLRLQRDLAQRQGVTLISRGGQPPVPAMTLPLRTAEFIGLHRYFVRGLASHHFAAVVPQSHYVGAGLLSTAGEEIILGLFRQRGRKRINTATRGRVFEYVGVQAVDDPAFTIWCFKAYGGITLAGDLAHSREASNRIWAMSSATDMSLLFGEVEPLPSANESSPPQVRPPPP